MLTFSGWGRKRFPGVQREASDLLWPKDVTVQISNVFIATKIIQTVIRFEQALSIEFTSPCFKSRKTKQL